MDNLNDASSQAGRPFVGGPALDELVQLVAAIRAAKLGAADMYAALADRIPGVDATLALRGLAHDEADHARRLERSVGAKPTSHDVGTAIAPGCGLQDESWPSALLAAFALDQAATAALVAIARLGEGRLAETAAWIVDEERGHQAFAIGAFRSVADADPSIGLRLAREMIVVRDWVKQVFPRHATLAELATAGVLPADAAKAHDSFLASLGDRVQDALGVLGDL